MTAREFTAHFVVIVAAIIAADLILTRLNIRKRAVL